jgi:hypothetical protein
MTVEYGISHNYTKYTKLVWEDNIKMDLQEVGRSRGDWIESAQDRDR